MKWNEKNGRKEERTNGWQQTNNNEEKYLKIWKKMQSLGDNRPNKRRSVKILQQ